ncbi:hypothetical protein HDU97_008599 [Phlyctochytrium planicorne]|nr:hypothetical protein HDU97_008599 [Phlyctochytrium planicorne]
MAERVRPYQGVNDALAQAQFAEKKWVWVADKEEGFLAGWIIKEDGDQVTVEFSNNTKRTLHVNDTEKMNPPKFDKAEDMADLTYLNEASVIHNLRLRYLSNLIYTYSGLFLVTVNPYKRLPIYTDEVVRSYKNKKRNEMAPHIYAIADAAYHDMLQDKENQSILITGESGAGKTENTKKVIQYLASVATSSEKGKLGTLEQQILQANPILESFGNAQTIRNNNSSRFGKFIRLEFNPSGQICGANIERYLLEKSRVTHQTSKERNYHIFYQLLKGAPADIKSKLLLSGGLNDYNFTKDSKKDIEGVDDAADFRLLQDSFNIMKLSSEEQNELYRCIAAVLHLGNIQSVADRDDQASLTEVGQSVSEKVCHVLGIPVAEFTKSLLKPKIKAGRDWVTQSRNVEQVQYSLEALARTLYERMFGKLVDRINEALYVPSSKSTFIGVLDIAGFEIFELNSFEQLCINYTNEKLQQFFNHHMFIIEQEEYRKEGIEWKFIDFGLDLQPTIDLIEKTSPIGILSLLDEECVMPKATDKTFIDKLNGLWKGKSTKYEVPRFNTGFIVSHYAGKVEYDTTGWLDKNKDPLNENITRLLAFSSEKYIAGLFADYSGEQEELGAKTRGITKRGAFRTVAQRHKEQLGSLMTQLYSTEPHFVRCIIPNEEKKPGKFNVNQVLEQLRCNGVLEGIRICRAGFPNRLSFMDFRQRYELLAPGIIPKGFMDGRSGAQLLLESLALDKNQYRIGTSKVFFRSGVLAQLEELRDVKLAKIVVKIQAIARGYIARKFYKKRLDQFRAIRIIQRNARIYVTLREWSWWKLYTKVKPLLNVTRTDEELRKREELAKEWEERAKKEVEERAKVEALRLAIETEKKRIEDLLIQERNAAAYQAELLGRTQKREVDLSEQLSALSSELEAKEIEYENILKTKKRLEADLRSAQDSLSLEKANGEKIEKEKLSRDQKIRELEDDLRREAENYFRIDNEKKNLEQQFQDMQKNFDSASDQVTDVLRTQAKLKSTITELEQRLENESQENKRLDSQKQAFASECGKLNASLAELAKTRADLESTLKRKESELTALNDRLRQETSDKEAVEKQKREAQLQLNATRGDLDNERIEKERLLKAKKKLEEELESLTRLAEEKTSEESKQGEIRKIREAELADLKSQLATALGDAELQRKTLGLNIDKLKVELDTVRGELLSCSKAKTNVERQVEDLKSEIDRIEEARLKSEKAKKQAETDLSSSKSRIDELEIALAELKIVKEALEVKVTSLGSKLEESEANASRFEREKQALSRQVDTLRDEIEEEVKRSSNLESQRKKLVTEITDLQSRIEEEESQRSDLSKRLTLKTQELESLKEKSSKELILKASEFDDYKKKAEKEFAELREKNDDNDRNLSNYEKTKNRLVAEIEDIKLELEREHNNARTAERLLKNQEAQLSASNNALESERRLKESAESNSRRLQSNIDSLNVELEEKTHQLSSTQKIKENLESELKTLIGEIGDSGRNAHELEKIKRRLELRIEELERQLSEEEVGRRRAEEAKNTAENQISELRRKFENELAAKDSLVDETRRMLMKEVNSLGEQLDEVTLQKNDALKQKKRLEETVESLSSKAENTAKGQSDLEKAKKKAEATIKELQSKLEDEEKARRNAEELAERHERRANSLQSDVERLEVSSESLERARKQLEKKVDELNSELSGGDDSKSGLVEIKKRLEKEKADLQSRLEEETEARAKLEAAKQSGANELELRNKVREDLELKIEKLEESRRALLAAQRLSTQELDDRAKDISNLEKQRKLLQSEIDDLKAGLEAEVSAKLEEAAARRKLAGEVQDLQIKLDAEVAKANDAVESASLYRIKADTLMNKLEAAELSKIKAEKSESALRIQNKELEEAVKEAINDRKNVEDKFKSQEQRIADLQEKQEEDSLEISDLQTVKRKLQEDIQQMQEKIRRENEEREGLIDQTRKKYQKEIKELISEIQIEKSNVVKFKEINKELESEIESLSSRIEAEIRNGANWKKDKERLEAKVDDLTKAYTEAIDGQDELQNQISSFQSQIRDLKSLLEDSEAQRSLLEKSKKTLEARLDEIGEQYQDADRARADLFKSVHALDQKTTELRDSLEDYQDQAKVAREKLRRAEQTATDASAELAKEKVLALDLEKSKIALEKQVKELNSRILDLESVVLQSSNGASKRLEARIEELQNQLDSETREKVEIQKTARKTERIIRELQFQVGEKDKQRQRQDEEMEKLDQKLKRMKTQIEELETSESNLQLSKRRAERESTEYRERALR